MKLIVLRLIALIFLYILGVVITSYKYGFEAAMLYLNSSFAMIFIIATLSKLLDELDKRE